MNFSQSATTEFSGKRLECFIQACWTAYAEKHAPRPAPDDEREKARRRNIRRLVRESVAQTLEQAAKKIRSMLIAQK